MDRANGGGPGAAAATSRAERFEDEKRRMIESCFNKKDVDGSLLETYITHIRITEYSAYPTTPPPPQARTGDGQKPRIIIVAVRKSGRVRLHKSKENSNGTFSIGKTWNLDDLTRIESYTGPETSPNNRDWAGDTGFQVTLGKPYFWHAQTDKEKKFFIASLIKIYGKYTGGKTPELAGFDQKEYEQVMGATRRPATGGSRPPPPPLSEQTTMQTTNAPPRAIHPMHPSHQSNQQQQGQQAHQGPQMHATAGPQDIPQFRTPPVRPSHPNLGASPVGSFDSSASRERPPAPRWMAQNNKSQDSVATSFRSDDGSSLPPRSRNGAGGQGAYGRFGEPNDRTPAVLTPPQPQQQPQSSPKLQPPAILSPPQPPQPVPSPLQLERPPPERRRPPMDPTRPQDRDLVPPPLISPGNKEPMAPPPRSSERVVPRMDNASQKSTSSSFTGNSYERDNPPPTGRLPDPPKREPLPMPPSLMPGSPPKQMPTYTPQTAAAQPPPAKSIHTPSPAKSYASVPAPARMPSPGPARVPSPKPAPAIVQAPVRVPSPSVANAPSPALALSPGSGGGSSDVSPMTVSVPRFASMQPPPELSQEEPTQPIDEPSPGERSLDYSDIDSNASPGEPGDTSKPGLGPMIKAKKSRNEIAGALWKAAGAANAATAFKPRPGGAGERMRLLRTKTDEGPDGISGVVPAPPKPDSRGNTPSEQPTPEETPKAEEETKKLEQPKPTEPPPRSANRSSIVPEVRISVPASRPASLIGLPKEVQKPVEPEKKETRRSINAGNDMKYLQSLGINPSILDERSDEFTQWLDYFGWIPGDQMRTRNVEDMRADLERELNKAQAGGWLARFREEDERVDAIKAGLDVAMAECEELDNLLTLYSVELSTLSEDIAYIEAQGQGLQVQTANQKLLKKELESLLETCAITSNELEVLRSAPLDDMRGLQDVESSLVTLYKAMIKIDPARSGADQEKVDVTAETNQNHGLNPDFKQMRIVQEKKQVYDQESAMFIGRFVAFMSRQFDQAFTETKLAMEGALSRKVDSTHHDLGRDTLWQFSPLMLYARDMHIDEWNQVIQIYQDKSQPVYRVEFQAVVAAWRRNARKLTGEEAELLFSTTAEKQQEGGVATTARKLTVKRSGTLARALRTPREDGGHKAKVDKTTTDNRDLPYEVFAGVLDDLLPLMQMEQNFIVDFFHATTLEQIDFPDAVATAPPYDRGGTDLRRPRLMEPDRELARRILRAMEVIFTFLEGELLRLMEWVVGQDPLQGIGVLAILEKYAAEVGQSNQEYLNTLLQKLHGHLEVRFKKFVDEQLRAIEETKVKISKRKGVISFIRIFPLFSAAVENMLVGVDATLAARGTIDREYDRILKTMFDSLMVIARENPAVSVTNGAADPEDKEALNFHILLIENMNHFTEEIDTRGLDVLEEWKEKANTTYLEHLNLYLNAVMRRPLGKILEHLENMETQLQTGKSPAAIAAQPSNSKTVFNKVLSNYDAKEIRKGIEALRKRVEKHFGDADDPALSRGLVLKVLGECENFYEKVERRVGAVTTDIYGGDILFEWPRADVKTAFR
ncbi:component of exocyst complex [Fusarium heterosporum]|uniref:Component of exocyst complex n=1 Tax=Fusarium heterosporum TaxID=42747 RepID=A0A8H5WL28_FUSHE|nr:component of exocyst complex [Fusarium heterosporum]